MWHAGEEDPDCASTITAENADSCAAENAHLNTAENAIIPILGNYQREAEPCATKSSGSPTAESSK